MRNGGALVGGAAAVGVAGLALAPQEAEAAAVKVSGKSQSVGAIAT